MINILIADDHSIVRAGIKKILENEKDLKVVGEVENAFTIVDFIQKNDCDLIILDINMPGRSGLDVISDIKKIKPVIKILVLSIYPEEDFAINALELGAAGYLKKDSTPKELVKAIRIINDGRKYVSEDLTDLLATRIDQHYNKTLHEKLSQREMEVLLLIGEGKTPFQIAEKLNLSISTVATYRSRILEKMNMKTNAALIHYVVKNNLIE